MPVLNKSVRNKEKRKTKDNVSHCSNFAFLLLPKAYFQEQRSSDSKISTIEESIESKTTLSDEANKAIEAIEYITKHLTQDNHYKRVRNMEIYYFPKDVIFQTRDEWKYVSVVIDRLLLYVFFGGRKIYSFLIVKYYFSHYRRHNRHIFLCSKCLRVHKPNRSH